MRFHNCQLTPFWSEETTKRKVLFINQQVQTNILSSHWQQKVHMAIIVPQYYLNQQYIQEEKWTSITHEARI